MPNGNNGHDSVSAFRSMLRWTPILMLHEVFPDNMVPLPPYSITQSGLRAVLRDFAERGYASGTLDDVVNGSRHKRVVLTFDDGTRDFIDYALPVLREFNYSATLFIVAGLVGKHRTWSALPGQPDLDPVPLMSPSELRDLQAEGFAIGSHTYSHAQLTMLSPEEALDEVTRSRQVLEDVIGSPVRWFAYPYSAANKQSRVAVRQAGYTGACGGSHQPHSRYYLNRVDASRFSLSELRWRTNGIYHSTRELVRQVRYGVR